MASFSPNIRMETEVVWRTGFTNHALLRSDDVFALKSSLNLPASRLKELASTLSEQERERARRFKFDIHRDRFIAGHGLLREVLGTLLKVPPSDLRFSQEGRGKPLLGGEFAQSDLRFNLSRSEGRFAVAVTRLRKVGVDIEFIETRRADEGVARTHFSPREQEELAGLQGKDWEIGFFNCWTRKEAFIKATGEGLYRPLDSFDVSLAPGRPAELMSVDSSLTRAARWRMLDLPFDKGYAGAVVAEGRDWNLTCWEYPS